MSCIPYTTRAMPSKVGIPVELHGSLTTMAHLIQVCSWGLIRLRNLVAAVEAIDPLVVTGKVAGVSGLLIESRGGLSRLAVGARAEIGRRGHDPLPAEVVGFRDSKALLMPFGPVEGVAPGADIRIIETGRQRPARPPPGWDGSSTPSASPSTARGRCRRGQRPIPCAPRPRPPIRAAAWANGWIWGVRAMDVFTTTCRGQRLGIFAGSGVGKSVLLSMLAKEATCDAVVVGLIGERGREVREFVEETLGEEGLKRAVVVVATSDEPALKRRQSAYMTMAIAEYPARPGSGGAVPDGQRHPLCDGPARDRSGGGRTADDQGLYPHRLHRTAQAAGARRSRPRCGRTARRRRPSPPCSPFWWTAATMTSRSPTPCAVFWTATSSWTERSPSAGAFPPSTC